MPVMLVRLAFLTLSVTQSHHQFHPPDCRCVENSLHIFLEISTSHIHGQNVSAFNRGLLEKLRSGNQDEGLLSGLREL
jgi:hypothetical protein